jgi:hypothetical protein
MGFAALCLSYALSQVNAGAFARFVEAMHRVFAQPDNGRAVPMTDSLIIESGMAESHYWRARSAGSSAGRHLSPHRNRLGA